MQTTVSSTGRPEAGVPGLLGDASFTRKVTGVSEEVSAEVPFGVMVGDGATADGFLKLAANTDDLKGIVIRGFAFHKDLEVGDTGLKPKTTCSLLTEGPIWVVVEGTLPTRADQVHVRAVATGAEVAGAFRVIKDGTDTIDITPFAQWTGRTATGAAELVLNLPNRALATADS